MSDLDLNSKQWCELVFEGKNQGFGAFQMRESSTSRHNKAMIIVAAAAIILISLPALLRYVVPEKKGETLTEVTTLSKVVLPPAKVENNEVIKRSVSAPPPALKSSVKFTAPKIVKDEEAPKEDVKTQDEVMAAKGAVSIADVVGNDDLHGVDIADVKEISADVGDGDGGTDEVFASVEQMPSFPGGEQALNKYIKDNLKYPTLAAENGMQGTVVVKFVVTKTGAIDKVELLNHIDRSLDEEAIRLIKSMPNWIPGKQNGQNASVMFTLRVRFQLGG